MADWIRPALSSFSAPRSCCQCACADCFCLPGLKATARCRLPPPGRLERPPQLTAPRNWKRGLPRPMGGHLGS